MDDQIEHSPEYFNELAASDPKAWVAAAIEENGLSMTSVEEFDDIEFHGMRMILVSEEGGCEGGGEHAERTFAIAPMGSGKPKNGRVEGAASYVEFYGFYSSYEGTEWDGETNIVEPVDVMVVQYKQK